MIVTCEECSTSFQLDESRIPATGARVRCSRCKHAFFLLNPSTSQPEAIDSIATDAAGDSLANVPAPTPDLSTNSLGDSFDTDADLGSDEAEEEDWQFSEEVRVEGDDEAEAESADELSSSGVFGTSLDVEDIESQGFSADELGTQDADTSDESSPNAAAIEEGRDDSDFGSVDDFSSLMEDDDDVSANLASEIESEMEIEESAAASSNDYSSPGSTDDLGDPESWDLVGSDDFSVFGTARAGVQASSLGDSNAAEDASAYESDSVVYDEEVGPASRVYETLSGVGRAVGWATTLVLIGAVLYFGLLGEWNRGAPRSQVVSAGHLTAQTTNSSWVETSRSGYVLLVEGQIRNEGSDSLWPGTLQLALLDDTGARLLTEEPRLAGMPIPEIILREGSAEEVVAAAGFAARSFRDSPLAPGETRQFVAIALEDRLPERATRFLLEMSDPARVTDVAAPALPIQSQN